jgi:hypothetical protein
MRKPIEIRSSAAFLIWAIYADWLKESPFFFSRSGRRERKMMHYRQTRTVDCAFIYPHECFANKTPLDYQFSSWHVY